MYLDSEGNVVAKHGGSRSVKAFDKSGTSIVAYLELKKKATPDNKPGQIDVILMEIELAKITCDDGKAKLKDLGELSKDQQAKLDGLALNAEVMAIAKTVKRNDAQSGIDAGRKLFEMKKAGRIPPGETEQKSFWSLILTFAESEKDAAAFEEGLAALKKLHADNPYAKKFLDDKEAALKKLKEEKKGQ